MSLLEQLERDAARWRFARTMLSIEDIEETYRNCYGHGFRPSERESIRADEAIDRVIADHKATTQS